MNAIPQFLLPVPVAGPDAGGAADTVRTNRVASFSMTCQQEDFWCWAAVAQAVERWVGTEVTQSTVASDHIAPGQGLVCATPLSDAGGGQSCGECTDTPGGCGDAHFLSAILRGRQRLAPNGATQEVPSFETIVTAIDAQRPLPVRIHWPNGDGHFVCVTGYRIDSAGDGHVTVHDPLSPRIDGGPVEVIHMPYDAFSTAYSAPSGDQGFPNYHYEVI